MTYSFNLIDRPWIPCITLEGEFVEVSLRGLLARAHKLREISCETPIMSASILPLTLAILHRVFGPEGLDPWEALWEAGEFDMERLDAYFEKWHERFDLFHPQRPFYQVKDNQVDPKSLIHLIHSIGNTATLFTHANDEAGIQLSAAAAARQLVTAQYFHTAGLGPRVGKTRKPFTDSAFARGVIFWMRGSTLFESLLLNLPPYPDQRTMPQIGQDMPCWEMDDPFALRQLPNGYLDYLTWQSNCIGFIPAVESEPAAVREMTMIPGLRLSSDLQSPQKRYIQKKKKGEYTGEYSFLYFNSNKALWRDYDSLLRRDEGTKPPAVIGWLYELTQQGPLEENYPLRLMATGMLADQTKPIFYRREVMPLPLKLLRNEEYVNDITGALKQAEEVASKLRNALNALAEHVLQRGAEGRPDSNDRKHLVKQWNALGRFWIELEPRFWDFIEELVSDSDQAIDQWEGGLKDIALESLRHAKKLAGDSPWAWKGGIVAERQLRAAINKLFNK